MRSVLALRHVPHEGLGAIADVLRRNELECQLLDMFQPAARPPLAPDQLAGLIVMGGPMNVDQTDQYPWLADEVVWIQRAIDAEIPVLGVCLGSQLLAKALGSRVYPNRIKEIGWYDVELTPEAADDPLFAQCGPRETVFQWHGDTFDLPDGAVLLAQSEACRQQAFRYGPSAYGLQFHIEVTPPMIYDWLGEPGNCGELAGLDYIDEEAIRRETPKRAAALAELGQRVLTPFAEMCLKRA